MAALKKAGVPFAERGGRLRGVLDLATGCYPAYLFGGQVGDQLPVFHFHDVTREWFEPRLRHLADNGYRTVGTDEIERLVLRGTRPGPRAVALTFDDAWESAWSVAMPLLRQYGMRAVLFAIPGRIADGDAPSPFVSWRQLREMHESGLFDVQSHTRSHAMLFTGDEIVSFVSPGFEREPLLNRPVVAMNGGVETVDPSALGTPLYPRRSRMSDGRRFLPDPRVAERCRAHVAANGGAAFFERGSWQDELMKVASSAGASASAFETADAQAAAIREQLAQGRAILNDRLGTTTVRHAALPWGISGTITRQALEATGQGVAFAERPLRRRGVRAGDDRYGLMRLNGRFLPCLPGRGRSWFFGAMSASR